MQAPRVKRIVRRFSDDAEKPQVMEQLQEELTVYFTSINEECVRMEFKVDNCEHVIIIEGFYSVSHSI